MPLDDSLIAPPISDAWRLPDQKRASQSINDRGVPPEVVDTRSNSQSKAKGWACRTDRDVERSGAKEEMKIHEYQGRSLGRVRSSRARGHVAFTVDEAVDAAQKLGGNIWVIKAQIHAGGRGKGGGVKLARSLDEVRSVSEESLGCS